MKLTRLMSLPALPFLSTRTKVVYAVLLPAGLASLPYSSSSAASAAALSVAAAASASSASASEAGCCVTLSASLRGSPTSAFLVSRVRLRGRGRGRGRGRVRVRVRL